MANSNNNTDTDENMLSVSDVGSMTSDEFRRYLEQLNSYNDNGSGDASVSPDTSLGSSSDSPSSPVSSDVDSVASSSAEGDAGKSNISESDNSTSVTLPSPAFNGGSSGSSPRLSAQRNTLPGASDQITTDEIAQFRSLRNIAADYFPDSSDPIADLTADIEDQIAQERGIDVNSYRSQLADRNDANLYREQQRAAADHQKSVQDTVNGWIKDAQQLRLIDPSFDLRTALRDSKFTDALRSGKTMFEAYSAQKANASAPVSSETAQPKRAPIAQNGREKRTGTGESSVNPAKMSSADFAAYIDRIKNG